MSSTHANQTWLWVSNIPEDVDLEEIINLFEKYGPVHNVDMAGTFSSIEFENGPDALRAKRGLDCVDFRGKRLNVTWYRKTEADGRAPNLKGHNWWGAHPGQPRNKYRLIVLNLPKGQVSQADLLTLAWEAGNSVVYLELQDLFIDIPSTYPLNEKQYKEYKEELQKNKHRLRSSQIEKLKNEYVIRKETTKKGIIEFAHYDDYKYAIDYIDGKKFKGNIIRILANKNYINLENQIIKYQNEMIRRKHENNRNNSNDDNDDNMDSHGNRNEIKNNDSRNNMNNKDNKNSKTLPQSDSRLRGTSVSSTNTVGSRPGTVGGVSGAPARYQYSGGSTSGASGVNAVNASAAAPPPSHMPIPTQHLTREQGPLPLPPQHQQHGMHAPASAMTGMTGPPPNAQHHHPHHHGHHAPPMQQPPYGNVRGSNAYNRNAPKHYNPYL